jgi:hypothetical protein
MPLLNSSGSKHDVGEPGDLVDVADRRVSLAGFWTAEATLIAYMRPASVDGERDGSSTRADPAQ